MDLDVDVAGWLSIGGDILDTILKVMVAIIIVLGIIWYRNYLSYRIQVRIRRLAGSQTIIKDDFGKEVVQDGAEYVKLRGLKELMPTPPSDSIDLDVKGRKVLEVYRLDKDQYVYIKDNRGLGGLKDAFEDRELVKSFEPVTTADRVVTIDQLKIAEQRKEKKIMDLLAQYAPIIGVIIILAIVFGFWNTLTEGAKEAMSAVDSVVGKIELIASEQAQTAEKMDRLMEKFDIVPIQDVPE